MKKIFVLLVLLAALALPFTLQAQQCFIGNVRGIEPLDHDELTIGAVASGFTAGTVQQAAGNAHIAVVTVETDQLRYWIDGTTPTGSSGHLADAGSSFLVCGLNSIKNFLAIRVTTDADIKVSYFRAR